MAGAALALAIAVVTALLVTRADDDAGRTAASPTPDAPRSAAAQGPRVGETLKPVGSRPRGIAIANGDLWVISARAAGWRGSMRATIRRHGTQPRIGRGAVGVAGHGDAVWVANSRLGQVIELDSETGRVRRRLHDAGGAGARRRGRRRALGRRDTARGAAPDVLFHYDRAGNLLGRDDVPNDITALTVGGGRAWLAHDGASRGSSDSAPSLTVRHRHVAASARPSRSTTAAGASGRASPPTTRSPGTTCAARRIVDDHVSPAALRGSPFAGGRVFVASNTDHTLVVVWTQRQPDPVGEPIAVPLNPLAVAAGAGHVWVSGLGANTLSRIDY